jgi:hypothetical protein
LSVWGNSPKGSLHIHPGDAYAIDDQTTIKVVDGVVEVVSEGKWRRFAVR